MSGFFFIISVHKINKVEKYVSPSLESITLFDGVFCKIRAIGIVFSASSLSTKEWSS